MKRVSLLWSLLLVCVWNLSAQTRELTEEELDDRFNFYVVNDLGRNGYYDQRPIAERMGEMEPVVGFEFIAALGDVHHFEGVASVNDPLWMTNYELVYAHPELMVDWFPILGNHEYRGNTQAVLDYAKVSRRWSMPARYYTKLYEIEDTDASIRLIFIDTTPLIDKYREEDGYPDARKQDNDRQLRWLDSVLTVNKATWTVVMGHHPIYAQTSKSDTERADMQQRVNTILLKHNVDMYVCGHIHNYQHIRRPDSPIDYIVNTSASLSREVEPTEGTVFCSGATGFSVCSASAKDLKFYMLDKEGRVLHVVERRK